MRGVGGGTLGKELKTEATEGRVPKTFKCLHLFSIKY